MKCVRIMDDKIEIKLETMEKLWSLIDFMTLYVVLEEKKRLSIICMILHKIIEMMHNESSAHMNRNQSDEFSDSIKSEFSSIKLLLLPWYC